MIEIILFLAITGGLIATILTVSASAIGVQRYRDSVNSLVAELQGQYSQIAAVVNSRDKGWTCSAAGLGAPSGVAGGSPRGTTDCFIMGRIITYEDNAVLTSATVIGTAAVKETTSTTPISDTAVFKQSQLTRLDLVDQTDTQRYSLEWQARLTQPGTGGTGTRFTVMILRSPLTGSVRTYINPTQAVTTPADERLLSDVALTTGLSVCVDQDGLFTGGGVLVEVLPGTATGSGVRQGGQDSRC